MIRTLLNRPTHLRPFETTMNHDAVCVQLCRDAGMADDLIDVVLTRHAKRIHAQHVVDNNSVPVCFGERNQRDRDSAELSRLCAERDALKRAIAVKDAAFESVRVLLTAAIALEDRRK